MITEPLPPGEEGILYADCDLRAQVGPKLRHDVVGQYHRPDVVTLLLDRAPRAPLIEVGDDEPGEEEADGDDGGAAATNGRSAGASRRAAPRRPAAEETP